MDSYWNNGYPDMSYFELDNILAKVDLDNSGKISFQEFILPAINAIKMVSDKMRCLRILRAFDVNDRGSITMKELEDGLKPAKPVQEF